MDTATRHRLDGIQYRHSEARTSTPPGDIVSLDDVSFLLDRVRSLFDALVAAQTRIDDLEIQIEALTDW